MAGLTKKQWKKPEFKVIERRDFYSKDYSEELKGDGCKCFMLIESHGKYAVLSFSLSNVSQIFGTTLTRFPDLIPIYEWDWAADLTWFIANKESVFFAVNLGEDCAWTSVLKRARAAYDLALEQHEHGIKKLIDLRKRVSDAALSGVAL